MNSSSQGHCFLKGSAIKGVLVTFSGDNVDSGIVNSRALLP